MLMRKIIQGRETRTIGSQCEIDSAYSIVEVSQNHEQVKFEFVNKDVEWENIIYTEKKYDKDIKVDNIVEKPVYSTEEKEVEYLTEVVVEKLVEIDKPFIVEVIKENPVTTTEIKKVERVTKNPVVTTKYTKQQIEVPKIVEVPTVTERII